MRHYRVLIPLFAAVFAIAQTPAAGYQPGTIMAVTPHQSSHNADAPQYDVSVKVGDTTYLVSYTPPNGGNTVKFTAGIELLVLVGDKTLTFNTAVAGKTEVPILSRTASAPHDPDWSKVCSEYFSLKLQHLTEKLSLTTDQQAKIKPILEQEAGEVGEICYNPALTEKDTLNQYDKILSASDKKISPLLSTDQVGKLHALRTSQRQDVKKIIADQKRKQA